MAEIPLASLIRYWGQDYRGPHDGMVLDFIESQSRQLASRLAEENYHLSSKELNALLIHSLGVARLPLPGDLNARVVGRITKPLYTIEKVIYETLPGFQVPAHLYLPDNRELPLPAVLCVPGHWMENSKLEPGLQQFCANLARLGFAALIFDPIGQGERLGNWLDHGHPEPMLMGVSQEGLMVYESQRALDYLASRPEIDGTRIGMIGASGGGLNTFYTSAIDKRIRTSIIVCYLTTYYHMMAAERYLNWEDGVDLCNQVPGVMAYAEMSDVISQFAPRPLRLINATQDRMVPIDGARQVFRKVQENYSFKGILDHVKLIEVDSDHGFDKEMRQAAMGWFAYHLQQIGDGQPLEEVELDLLTVPYPSALTYISPPERSDLPLLRKRDPLSGKSEGLCFPKGECPPPGSAITQLVQRLASTAADNPLPKITDDPFNWENWKIDLQNKVGEVFGPFPPAGLLNVKLMKQNFYQGLFAERVVFESEPGIILPSIFITPIAWKDQQPVILYLNKWGKQAGIENGDIQMFLSAGFAVFAVDLRGSGETAVSEFESTTNACMTDRPLFAQRVWDILRSIDCLWNRIYIGPQIDKGRIVCVGRGSAGMLALYAAALDDRIAACVAWQSPVSYLDLITENPSFPASIYLFDVLNYFDIPQIMAMIAPRPLLIAEPVDGCRNPLLEGSLEGLFRFPRLAYSLSGAENQFLDVVPSERSMVDPAIIAQWILGKLAT